MVLFVPRADGIRVFQSFPEILNDVKETYDVNSCHAFGKFKFKQRELYNAELHNCQPVASDLLLEKIEEIKRPALPKWFVAKRNIANGPYSLVTHNDFFLIAEKNANRIYFLR